jgi:hypothetical protein
MRIAVALILACIANADIVDRVAANIGRNVITDAQVTEEIRVTSFLQGDPVDLAPENRRKALDRLVDQFLVRRELEFTRFAGISDVDIQPVLKSARDQYTTEAEFNAALAKYEITADELKRHITWTLTMLRFIEYRFQPAVQINNTQLRQEYQRQAVAWKQKHGTDMAPLEQVQPDIEKIVRQRFVDASLDRWLGEVRTQNEIIYHAGYKL